MNASGFGEISTDMGMWQGSRSVQVSLLEPYLGILGRVEKIPGHIELVGILSCQKIKMKKKTKKNKPYLYMHTIILRKIPAYSWDILNFDEI